MVPIIKQGGYWTVKVTSRCLRLITWSQSTKSISGFVIESGSYQQLPSICAGN